MPNRIIKDSIRISKKVNSLSDFNFRVWTYLITYVDDFGRGSADPELLKGLVFTRRKSITEQQISKALADLATIGMITLYEVDGESYFCFPNWAKHQRIRDCKPKFPAPEQPDDGRSAAKAVSLPQVAVSCGEPPPESESKSELKSISCSSGAAPTERESDFDLFWKSYPRKVGKGNARKIWARLKPDAELLQQILSKVEACKSTPQWQSDNGQYIPYPATWLNQCRWEDEVETQKARNSSYDIDELEELSRFDVPEELCQPPGGEEGSTYGKSNP